MTSTLEHRGPDDAGTELVCESPAVALGHTRLSIIDTSSAGHQPMLDPDGQSWISFNGEIYNYREIRRELDSKGRRFRTQTDTEVLLAAWSEWKSDCLLRLRGIFAFAIWDSRTQTLFLARDQLGVKPLYYWANEESMVFGSEVRTILASDFVSRTLDVAGLGGYLAFGSVQDPQTLVRGVRSLLPGQFAEWRAGRLRQSRYWALPSPAELPAGNPAGLREVGEALEDATVSQMVADVPLGAFLSGGIDSTAIVALMQRARKSPVRTFSITFEESHWDEREYSRLAAKHIGTDHTELLLTGSDVRSSLSQALSAYDQPSVDGLNTYFVSKVTRESGLTVALSGVGGDEVFGGYDGYRRARLAERGGEWLRFLPRQLRRILSRMLASTAPMHSLSRYEDFLEGSRAPYFASRQLFGKSQIAKLLTLDIAEATGDPPSFAQLERDGANYDPVNRAAAFELQTYMLSTLLRDTDQMSMAHALEVRVPLIDHRLVELLFRIPGPMKVDSRQPKPLLTLPLGDAIPRECVHRPKRGFELPFSHWLRETMEGEMREVFLSESIGQPFESTARANLWRQFESGRVSWSRVWAVFVASTWLDSNRVAA